ncbi:MAG: MarR family transcriptional regulator, partial [Acidobacteriota bacterium]
LIALSEEGFRRQRSIALTPAGLEVLERGLPMWREAQEEMAQKLGEDWETVRGLLDRLASLE